MACNSKVNLVFLLALFLPAYVQLHSIKDLNPCALVRCAGRCVNYEDCSDIPCELRAKCVPLTTSGGLEVSKIRHPCVGIFCIRNTICVSSYWHCRFYPCLPRPKCVPRTTTTRVPIPEIRDPCHTVFCVPNTICVSSYDHCESYPCIPRGKCVPRATITSGGLEAVTIPEIQNPCAAVLCAPNTICETSYDHCESYPCIPRAKCVPRATTTATDPVPATIPKESPCNLIDCRDGYRCREVDGDCLTGVCEPKAECVPIINEDISKEQCSLKTDFNKLCDKDCPDSYECRCQTLPYVRCTAESSCLFPLCTVKDTTSNECTELGASCNKKCIDSMECRCDKLPNRDCADVPSCLYPKCMAKEQNNAQQCTQYSDSNQPCKMNCNETSECRCIKRLDTFCYVGPCLTPTCINKDQSNAKPSVSCGNEQCKEGYFCKRIFRYCFTTPCPQPPPRCEPIPTSKPVE